VKESTPSGISVVLCCHNSESVVGPTVAALSSQNAEEGFPCEVLLVDNNCTDDTVEVARAHWKGPASRFRVLPEEKPGLMHARRRGVSDARHGIVLFVDDDNLLEPGWLRRLHGIYENHGDVGAVGGMVLPLFEDGKPPWFDAHAGVFACGAQAEQSGTMPEAGILFGAGLSFRTSVISDIFDGSLPLYLTGRTNDVLTRGDDAELCMRCSLAGWKLLYDQSLVLRHRLSADRLRWEYVLRARRGGGAAEVVLSLYRHLLYRVLPPSYAQMSRTIRKAWMSFYANLRNFTDLSSPGNPRGARYQFLLGQSEELERLGEEGFQDMREKILRAFAEAASESVPLKATMLGRVVKGLFRSLGYEITRLES
jgi:glycosyltransferase involved in cell wall biosynthesis